MADWALNTLNKRPVATFSGLSLSKRPESVPIVGRGRTRGKPNGSTVTGYWLLSPKGNREVLAVPFRYRSCENKPDPPSQQSSLSELLSRLSEAAAHQFKHPVLLAGHTGRCSDLELCLVYIFTDECWIQHPSSRSALKKGESSPVPAFWNENARQQ
jgi:hypothetical protein